MTIIVKLKKLKPHKNHLKRDGVKGWKLNGIRQPILYIVALDKPPRFEIISEAETKRYKKFKKTVLNEKTFYLEYDERDNVDFDGETLTFAFLLIKIQKRTELRKIWRHFFCVGGRHHLSNLTIEGNIIETGQNFSNRNFVRCSRKKSMTFSDNTTAAKDLGSFCQKLGRSSTKKIHQQM